MLHIAPEQCFYKLFGKMSNLKYVTADLNSPIADVHMDLHKPPFGDNSFDIIFCNHVLEHVEDADECMRQLYRIMRPGGWGIFQVPLDITREKSFEDKTITDPREREKHFWQKDHVRLFGLDYRDRLAAAGFRVKVDDFVNQLTAEEVDRFRLPPGEMIYVCYKD